MSSDDKDMAERIYDNRTAGSAEAPPPPKAGLFKGSLLLASAVAVAIQVQHQLNGWLGLSYEEFADSAAYAPLFVLVSVMCDARPANLRHWAMLAATAVSAGAANALVEAGISWLVLRLAPAYSGGWLAYLVAMVAGCVAVLYVYRAAHRVARADNLIFPRDDTIEGKG